jgi:hypothetical protein
MTNKIITEKDFDTRINKAWYILEDLKEELLSEENKSLLQSALLFLNELDFKKEEEEI